LRRYIEHGGFWRAEIPESARYYKMANRDYLEWSARMGFIAKPEAIVMQLYSEVLQKFRLAALGHGEHQPPAQHRERVATYFDPLPIWYEPFESAQVGSVRGEPVEPQTADTAHPSTNSEQTAEGFPLYAITQRPMFMYHAWGSQNAWLRQIATRNWLYLHPDTAAKHGIADEDWVDVESHNGRITVQAKFAGNVQPDTVWTWNAIGKRRGAWKLAKDAPEGRQGFLLNHLISDRTPADDYANADPVTGQAAWFDLRVRISKAQPASVSAPQFPPLHADAADDRPLRYGAAMRKHP
jgi:anaerobic selenocysteine-containing dehydrogenase